MLRAVGGGNAGCWRLFAHGVGDQANPGDQQHQQSLTYTLATQKPEVVAA